MLDIFELVSLLEQRILEANSYVFELREKKWMKVCELKVLTDTSYQFGESAEYEKPNFTPPHKLPVDTHLDQENADYDYLLKHALNQKIQSEQFEDVTPKLKEVTKEKLHLEKTITELNEYIHKIDSESDSREGLNFELENIISELKLESSDLTSLNAKLEEQILEKENAISSLVEQNELSLKESKLEYEDSIIKAKKLGSEVESLNYKIKSLKFALKVEREKYSDLKDVVGSINTRNENETVKDKVLEQAFSYFTQGPVGDGVKGLEIDRLKKKIKFLENELKENETLFSEKVSELKTKAYEESSNFSARIIDIEKSYETKINDLSSDKRILETKVSELELSLQKSLTSSENKTQAPIIKKEIVQGDDSRELTELRSRYEKSVENFEKIIAQKDSRIKELTEVDNKVVDSRSEKYLKQEIIKYKNSSESKDKEIQALKAQLTKLSKQGLDIGTKSNKQVEFIKDLEKKNAQLTKEVKDLTKKTEAYKDEYKKLFEKNNKAIEKIQSQSSTIQALNSGQEESVVQTQKEIENLNTQVIDIKGLFEKEQLKAKQLEKELEEAKKVEPKIELATSADVTPAVSEDDELKRLIGDSYEVENESIWTVELEDGKKSGPHPFSVVYDMKEDGKIGRETRVKKAGQGYKTCSDIFELSTRVFTHGEGDERRFFIKRNSVRVPYYELISFEMNGNEYKGYCTSISTGGIFIELTSIKEDEYKIDSKGRVFFPRGAIENPFNCVAQIKNISHSKPKGIGLMFIELPEKAKDDILNYVNTYLNQSKKSA
jgi:hypothetical protein